MCGSKPKYNYYVGSSQGGREALTVADSYQCSVIQNERYVLTEMEGGL